MTAKNMRVGLVVDHPKRDLGGAVRIAHALASRGAETCLIPLYDQGLDVPLLDLDVLVVNYARPVNLELVTGYVEQGIPVFVLDTEGGVLSQEGANSIRGLTEYIAHSPYARLLSGYLFWGSLLRDAFADAGILGTGGLHLTGCPRFDVASPRWRDTLDYPADGYILVNANFPLVNPAFAKDAGEETKVLVGSGWKQDYVSRMVEDQKKILAGFLDTVHRLAARFPQKRFLVRSHPFEGDAIYRNRFADVDNVTVDGSGNVLNVIRHCACLLHLNCGTSIEAVMLERLPVSMEFLNTEHMANHSTLPSRISMKAASFEQLVDILEDLPAACARFDFDAAYRGHIHGFFHENDGAAGDRLAQVLLAAPPRSRRPGLPRRIAWSLNSSRATSRLGQRLQAATANLMGTRTAAWLRSRVQVARQGKALDADVVRKLAQSFAQHEQRPQPSVAHARHPVSGLPLSSILVRPPGAAAGGRTA
jgi:surface carbohydrate biosynthesis protein